MNQPALIIAFELLAFWSVWRGWSDVELAPFWKILSYGVCGLLLICAPFFQGGRKNLKEESFVSFHYRLASSDTPPISPGGLPAFPMAVVK
jgi:hypothetical protein